MIKNICIKTKKYGIISTIDFSQQMSKSPQQGGFTLIELIISIAIIMIMVLGVYGLIIFAIQAMNENKMGVVANELANQKMEQIRNMPYDEVGIVSGMPPGTIPASETVQRGGEFTINSYVAFYDDPADGQAGSTTPDTIPTDYKIATVKVVWTTRYGTKDVTVFSKIIPRTVETNMGYGLLKLTVRDSYAQPVPSAEIRVINNAVVPAIDVTNITDTLGQLYLPATSSNESFEIIVTKIDLMPGTPYGQDQTYAAATGKTPRHLTVTQGNMTSEEFQIDKLARLRLRTVSANLPDNWQANRVKAGFDESAPRVAADAGASLYYAWQAQDAASSKVYVGKTDAAGTKLWAADKAVGTSLSERAPDIAALSAGGAMVVWQDSSVGLKKITRGPGSSNMAAIDDNLDQHALPAKPEVLRALPMWAKEKVVAISSSLYNKFRKLVDRTKNLLAGLKGRLAESLPDKADLDPWPRAAKAVGTIVQSVKVSPAVGASNSITLSFNNPPTAGNMLIAIAIHENSSEAFTGVSNASGVFSQSVVSNAAFGLDVGVWHKAAGAGEPSSVTVTASGNMEGGVLMLMEVSGIDTSNPVNVTRTNDQTGSASRVGTTGLTTAASTNDGFAIAAVAFADNDFNNPTSANWTSGSTAVWTQRNWTEINGDDDSSIGVATADIIAAAQQQATLTVTGGGSNEERNSVLVVYNLINPDDVSVAAGGTQTNSLMQGSASQHVGGYFVLSELTGAHAVTSIRVFEEGTIDAQADLDNIKLFYDLDTSAPYDCASESFDGSEPQYGATDTDGFSGPDGSVTMIGSVTPNLTTSVCIYAVMDIGVGAAQADTIELYMADPSTDVVVTGGTAIPNTKVAIAGQTEVYIPGELHQNDYRWRADDAGESAATWLAPSQTAVSAMTGDNLRLRLRVTNSGNTAKAASYRLEYAKKAASCAASGPWAALPNDNSLEWRTISSTNYNDADATTQQLGAGTFAAGQMKEDSSQAANLSLDGIFSVEYEFAVSPTANADDGAYCFRLSDAGAAIDAYDTYAESNVIGDENVYIVRLDAAGNAVWATKRVNSDDTSSNQIAPRLALTERFGTATTVVVWQDDRGASSDIYAQAFDINGNVLWNGGNDLVISASSSDETDPVVAIDSEERVLIAWTDAGGTALVRVQRFSLLDGSAIWAAPVTAPGGLFPTSEAELAVATTSDFYLAYSENAAGALSSYVARFASDGSLLWDQAVNKDSIATDRFSPDLAFADSGIYAAWTDYRSLNRDIYGQKLDFDGNPLWSRDLLLNVTTSSSTQDNCALAVAGSRIFGAWSDGRAADTAVFAAELLEPSAITQLGNVSLHVRGENTISETPKVYEYDLFPITDASGAIDLWVEPDFSGYQVESTSTLSVVLVDPPMPLPIVPGEDRTWTVYLE